MMPDISVAASCGWQDDHDLVTRGEVEEKLHGVPAA